MAKAKTISDFDPEVMKMFAEMIKSVLPEGIGFSLVLFELNKTEGLTEFKYISNGQRADLISNYEALVAKWKYEASLES